MSYAVCAGEAPLESLEIVPMSDRIRFEHPIDARPADAELLGDRSGSRGPAHSSDARVPRLSKPAGLVDPGSGRDDHLRRGVLCAIGVRGAHCIKFSTRTRSRGALIFIEDFSREASSLHGNGLFCVLRRVAGARRWSAAYPPLAAVPGRRRQRQSRATTVTGTIKAG